LLHEVDGKSAWDELPCYVRECSSGVCGSRHSTTYHVKPGYHKFRFYYYRTTYDGPNYYEYQEGDFIDVEFEVCEGDVYIKIPYRS